MQGWEWGNPRLDDEPAPNRSTFKLNVDPGECGFDTRDGDPAPYFEHRVHWDRYHGYIHIPSALDRVPP